MIERQIFFKVGLDMFFIQLVWTFGFLGVVFVVNIVKLFLSGLQGNAVDGYFHHIYAVGNIYMLVIGIITVLFLPHFVGNGVTRKDYFFGGVIAAALLALAIPFITVIVSFIEKFILTMIGIQYKVQSMNEVMLDGNIIGDLVQLIIVAPYVEPQDDLFLSLSVLAINLFVYYILGWLIGTSFYRFDVVGGILSVALAIGLKLSNDAFLRIVLDLPLIGWFQRLELLPESVALIGIFVIILVTFIAIRMMTKRVAIKL